MQATGPFRGGHPSGLPRFYADLHIHSKCA